MKTHSLSFVGSTLSRTAFFSFGLATYQGGSNLRVAIAAIPACSLVVSGTFMGKNL